MVKTVLWDWNGTLLDDLELCVGVINGLLAYQGRPPIHRAEYRRQFGFPVVDFYRRIGLDMERDSFDYLARAYMDSYTPLSAGCTLVPHALETLAAVREKGVRQIILSASMRENLDRQIRRYPLEGYFDEILAMTDFFAAGKAEAARAWLQRQEGLDPKDVLLVGDTAHDLAIAKELGFACALYEGGHQYVAPSEDHMTVSDLWEIVGAL